MAVAVNKVPDTIMVNSADIHSPSTVITNAGFDETYIKGIVRLKERMIILITVLEMIKGSEIIVSSN